MQGLTVEYTIIAVLIENGVDDEGNRRRLWLADCPMGEVLKAFNRRATGKTLHIPSVLCVGNLIYGAGWIDKMEIGQHAELQFRDKDVEVLTIGSYPKLLIIEG